jgi:hypothetical protein
MHRSFFNSSYFIPVLSLSVNSIFCNELFPHGKFPLNILMHAIIKDNYGLEFLLVLDKKRIFRNYFSFKIYILSNDIHDGM